MAGLLQGPFCLLTSTSSVSVVLAAFMISYYPTNVLESMAALEQTLFDSVVPMLEACERI